MSTNPTYPEWKNNGKIKLAIIVGTRSEIIRLAAVITKCRKYFDTQLWHTGQNYDMPILYSCHPRSRKRLKASGFKLDPRIIAHEPLGFHDYN